MKRTLIVLSVALLVPACGGGGGGGGGGSTTGNLVDIWISDPGPGDDFLSHGATDGTHVWLVGDQDLVGTQEWRYEKRLLADGSLDTAFDGDGILVPAIPGGDASARAVAVDGTFLYTVGYETPGANETWRIEKRSLVDGTPDNGFGTLGVVSSQLAGTGHAAQSIAIDGSWMYVVGVQDNSTDPRWRIEKLSLVDGSYDAGFLGAGRFFWNPSGGDDEAVSVALDGGFLYILGEDQVNGDTRLVVQKRDAGTGMLDLTFGTNGEAFLDPSAGDDDASHILVDAGWIYVSGLDDNSGDTRWYAERIDTATGTPDAGFTVAGCCAGFGPDFAGRMVIDGTNLYIGGADFDLTSSDWRIEKRSTADGSLLAAFGSVPGNLIDVGGMFMAVVGEHLFVGGLATDPVNGDWHWRVEKRIK